MALAKDSLRVSRLTWSNALAGTTVAIDETRYLVVSRYKYLM